MDIEEKIKLITRNLQVSLITREMVKVKSNTSTCTHKRDLTLLLFYCFISRKCFFVWKVYVSKDIL